MRRRISERNKNQQLMDVFSGMKSRGIGHPMRPYMNTVSSPVEDPPERVSACVAACTGASPAMSDQVLTDQAAPDERRCDLELSGLVLDGLDARPTD